MSSLSKIRKPSIWQPNRLGIHGSFSTQLSAVIQPPVRYRFIAEDYCLLPGNNILEKLVQLTIIINNMSPISFRHRKIDNQTFNLMNQVFTPVSHGNHEIIILD